MANGNWENNKNILYKISPISNKSFSVQLQILKNQSQTELYLILIRNKYYHGMLFWFLL